MAETESGSARRRGRRRRWQLAALAVPLVAGVGIYLALRGPDPEDVVTDYLEAVRSGDLDTALTYTDLAIASDGAGAFLLDGKAGDDWSFSRVTGQGTEYTTDDNIRRAAVDVTLTGEDGVTAQGRFELAESSHGWTIDNPLIDLVPGYLPTDYVEFNGVTTGADRSVSLFPGVYRGFTDSAALFGTDVAEYVAVPSPDLDAAGRPFAPRFTPTDALDEALNTGIADWVDDCAAERELMAENCPLRTGSAEAPDGYLTIDRQSYWADTAEWTIEEYPTGHVRQAEAGFAIQTVSYGLATLTIEGESDDDGRSVTLSLECDLALDGFTARLTADGGFTFTGDPDGCEPRSD